MLELYVVTDWNGYSGTHAVIVEAESKADALRLHLLLQKEDWEPADINAIDVDYRGAVSNRPYVEAELELQKLSEASKTMPVIDFADAMIERWKQAEAKLTALTAEVEQFTGIEDHLALMRLNINELEDEIARTNEVLEYQRSLINEEIKTNERLRKERRELGGRNVAFKEQIDDLRHLIGYQEHELETFRHEAQKVKLVTDITIYADKLHAAAANLISSRDLSQLKAVLEGTDE